MSHAFAADAMRRAARRNMRWYQDNQMNVLRAAKEKHARDIDQSIALAEQLMKKLEEKVDLPTVVPLRELVPSQDDSLMKPVEPRLLRLLYNSTEKGSTERYMKERNKQSPEDKFFFRVATSWDYGWQQKQSRLRARDVNRGRCAILRDTFYRKNNPGPDAPHYAQPSGGEVGICSQYACGDN